MPRGISIVPDPHLLPSPGKALQARIWTEAPPKTIKVVDITAHAGKPPLSGGGKVVSTTTTTT